MAILLAQQILNLIKRWRIKFKPLISKILLNLIVIIFLACESNLILLGIARVLESIDHSKYLPLFIEHEIDYQTFLSLEDADLKELGIKALGSRKKILSVIKDLQRPAAPSIQRPAGFDF